MTQRILSKDYWQNEPVLQPFYRFSPQKPDWETIVAHRQAAEVERQTLANVLAAQNRLLPQNEAAMANIELLRRPNTFTITTGQQPALFGGPLYVVYKTLTAIKLCEELKRRFPDLHFVPVFWIATEDHDYAEVNHTYFSYEKPTVYPAQFSGAVGRHIIEDSMRQLTAHLPPEIAEFYATGESWAEAFRRTLHYLLGGYGLVCLDPDDARLKRRFAPVMRRELLEQRSFPLLEKAGQALAQAGYPHQLKGRPVNLFYLTEHGRFRLEQEAGRWTLAGGGQNFSTDELLNELDAAPQRFSPNAALRPLYQETLLPNLAYVGGWGETAYWLQLKEIFDDYGVFYPLVLPRASAFLIPETEAALWRSHDLTPQDVLLPDADLKHKMAQSLWNANDLAKSEQQILAAFQDLAQKLEALSPGQARNARGMAQKNNRFLQDLPRRIERELLKRNPQACQPLLRSKNRLQPDGWTQERALNLLALTAEPQKWVRFLYQNLKTEPERQIFVL